MNNQSANANPRQRARDVVLLTAAAICSWRLAKIVASPGLQLDVIPTLVVLGRKHFKHVKPEAEHEPKHPAVKFILDVWNQGDFSEAEKYVAPDLAMSINGFVYESTPEDHGPGLAQESVEYWRAIMPDLRMDLLQEIRKKDQIAISRPKTTQQPAATPATDRGHVRRTFDIFEDQLAYLTRASLEDRLAGGEGSMNSMVRHALDDFIAQQTGVNLRHFLP